MTAVGPIVETALFVEDVARAVDFYERLLGLETVRHDASGAVLRVGPTQVLLLVDPTTTREPKTTPGGEIPACGASGSLHLAFAIEPDEVGRWRVDLEAQGLEVSHVSWERGAESLYFRDADGHLVELLTDVEGLWDLEPRRA